MIIESLETGGTKNGKYRRYRGQSALGRVRFGGINLIDFFDRSRSRKILVANFHHSCDQIRRAKQLFLHFRPAILSAKRLDICILDLQYDHVLTPFPHAPPMGSLINKRREES
jgi:hypothetical protein